MDGLGLGSRTALAALLLGAALVAWVVAVQRMRGMDAGRGTDLEALGWFIGIWVTMMAAFAVVLVALGVWVAASTASVLGLKQPTQMQMQR